MSRELTEFLLSWIDLPQSQWTPREMTPNEVMEVLWDLNDVFRPFSQRLATVPYSPNAEAAADAAIVEFARMPEAGTWAQIAPPVLRVLLERHLQMLAVCAANMAAGEKRMEIMPNELPREYLLPALVLSWLLRMKLPRPPAGTGGVRIPSGSHPGTMSRH